MVDKVIMRSLKTDPSARFQNATEMREALEAALREPELARKRRRRAGFVALGALMSALVAGVVVVGRDPALMSRATSKVTPMLSYVQELRQGKQASPALAQAPAPVTKSAPPAVVPAEDPELETAELTDESEEGEIIDLDLPEALGDNGEADKVTPANEAVAALDEGQADEGQADEGQADEGQADEAEGEAKAQLSAEASVPNVDLEAQLVQAEQQMTDGNRLKGFNTIKRLAWTHPKDARALRAYSEAAVSMKAWGEAYRAAYNWAEVDKGPDAKLQLAKLERATSRGNYKHTLKKLLAEHPENAEAIALLGGASNKALAQRDE